MNHPLLHCCPLFKNDDTAGGIMETAFSHVIPVGQTQTVLIQASAIHILLIFLYLSLATSSTEIFLHPATSHATFEQKARFLREAGQSGTSRSVGGLLSDVDRDLARFRLLFFRQVDRQDTVFHLGGNLVLIHFLGQLELPEEVQQCTLCISFLTLSLSYQTSILENKKGSKAKT